MPCLRRQCPAELWGVGGLGKWEGKAWRDLPVRGPERPEAGLFAERVVEALGGGRAGARTLPLPLSGTWISQVGCDTLPVNVQRHHPQPPAADTLVHSRCF